MIHPIRTIVAGIAEVNEEDPLLESALELARRTGASLHLLHTFEVADGGMSPQEVRRHSESLRRKMQSTVAPLLRDEWVQCWAIAASPATGIEEVAKRKGADLIVVGATRDAGRGVTVLGSTARELVRSAPAPVLVVKHPIPAVHERVLLTTDLSPASIQVHEGGLDLVNALDRGEIDLRSLLVLGWGEQPLPPLRVELLEEIGRGELERFLKHRRQREHVVEPAVRLGDITRQTLAEANEWRADLLILSADEDPGVRPATRPNTAEATASGSRANVLVIPRNHEPSRPRAVPSSTDVTVLASASAA